MGHNISRRRFMARMGAGATTAAIPALLARGAAAGWQPTKTKPILGSWISVLWSDRRHHYWNDTCAKFSRQQWEESVKEVAGLGMQYLVLLATVIDRRAFFDTPLVPKAKELACGDPIEALLSAADQCGVRLFISTGFYGDWLHGKALTDPKIARGRFDLMTQVTEKVRAPREFLWVVHSR